MNRPGGFYPPAGVDPPGRSDPPGELDRPRDRAAAPADDGDWCTIELFLQTADGRDRQIIRVRRGTSIRELLVRAGHPSTVAAIEAGERGLARHGSRARIDDPLTGDSRIEVMLPITADAKAWRHQRVAARRAAKQQGGWNRRGRST